MNKQEFLEGLQHALSGEVPPEVVRENMRYYDDYIQTELQKGRSEADVMGELGDPRLIARTIIDTTPGAGEEVVYETYESSGTGSDSRRRTEETGSRSGGVHYYDLSKWYWKLLGVVLVVMVIAVIVTVVGGLLSLVIPLLPALGLLMLVMWFVRGPRR